MPFFQKYAFLSFFFLTDTLVVKNIHECLGCRYDVFTYVYQFNFKFEYSCKQSPKESKQKYQCLFFYFLLKKQCTKTKLSKSNPNKLNHKWRFQDDLKFLRFWSSLSLLCFVTQLFLFNTYLSLK